MTGKKITETRGIRTLPGVLVVIALMLSRADSALAQCQWTSGSGTITQTCGSVGIGTTSPANLLHVVGTANTSAIFEGGASTHSLVQFRNGTTSRGYFGYINSGSMGLGFLDALGSNVNMLLTDNGKLGIGTQTPYSKLSVVPGTSGRQIAIGDWTDFSGSWSGYGLFGGNMYQDTSFTGLRYSNTHGFIGAVGFAVNYPNWNQATIVSSGTTSSTAGASFTPIIIATFDYTGKVGIGTSTPNAKLHISGPSSGFGSGLKITSTDVGGKTFSFYASLSTLIIGDETVGSARLAIDTNGKIGIGTTTPSTNLHVVGDVALTGSGNITNSGNITATGTISGGNVIAKYQDVAEWVPARNAMSAGTVVTLDPEHSNLVVASSRSYDTRVAGVVSEKPGVILGEGGQGKVMVATTGRVRVKVDATNGPIRVGDLLVTSDKEGIAMRSQPLDLGGTPIHRPGTLIGKALEPLEKGVGEILVLLSLQ